jgi:hypothetical protein
MELISELFQNKSHVNYAKIWCLGILFQGVYQFFDKGKLNFPLLFLYIFFTFVSSLLYYKVFTDE